ncbi:FHA domain-containing protein, partial [Microbulbifer sp. 2201CG32-9]|uniref:hypothetical protein n=1 Tax=Microbulbifer sp. 2201CG32-9 TaxID=3232309 RepID=UPI00345B63F8
RNSSRRVLRFLIVYSASAKVSWLMIESVYVGNGVNYARLEQFFRGSLEDNSVKHTLLVDKEFRWGDRISTRHFTNSLTVYTNHGNPSDSTTQMGDLSINGNFTGKLYAPYAKVVLGNGKIFKGCLFAKNIELHQDSEITGTNVETKRVCECRIIEPVNNGI